MEHYDSALKLCDLEPVHIPGTIQPHGLLLVLDAAFHIMHISQNCQSTLGLASEQLLNKHFSDLVGTIQWQIFYKQVRFLPPLPPFPFQLELLTTLDAPSSVKQKPSSNDIDLAPLSQIKQGRRIRLFDGLCHKHSNYWFVELEPAFLYESALHNDALYHLGLAEHLIQSAVDTEQLCYYTAQQVQRLSGFQRVMIYQFSDDWHGKIIAEISNDKSTSYLGLQFPASDIPTQVRQLYMLHKTRLIVDCEAEQVPIASQTTEEPQNPLDLTYVSLRGVSPVHCEYLQNMQVRAAFSVSILIDGQLWGLLVGHHPLPKRLSYATRTSCEALVNQLALQLRFHRQLNHVQERQRITDIVNQLIQNISVVRDSLSIFQDETLLDLFSAEGAYIALGNRQVVLGTVPDNDDILQLQFWLNQQVPDDLFYTHELKQLYPLSEKLQMTASGILYIPLVNQNNEYILLFRAERVETVNWAGNPHKTTESVDNAERISPRKSFDLWQQQVYGQSAPWTDEEIEAANELRLLLLDKINSNRVYSLIEQRVEARTVELRTMNEELKNFAYIVSHDMRAPLINIRGFNEELRLTLDEIYALLKPVLTRLPVEQRQRIEFEITSNMPEAMDYVDVSVNKMEQLISATAKLSRLGHRELLFEALNMQELISECLKSFAHRLDNQGIKVSVECLPDIIADRLSIQQIFSNLLDNALKYTSPNRPGRIVIKAEQQPDHTVFWIQDNGRGIAPHEVDKIFQMFQRAGEQNQPGEGMGLSFVQTLVHRHGGQIHCESALDKGTTFMFSISRTNDIIFV